MGVRKILFPTKFEELSLEAVRSLYGLREAGFEEIVFLHVIERSEVAFNLTTGFDRELAEQMREDALLRFKEWEKEVQAEGFPARCRVEVGNPAPKILQVACEEQVDLIVVGRHRPLLSDDLYLGGEMMEVLRLSPKPVMVWRGVADASRPLFSRILFPTDFSKVSERAYDFIKDIMHSVSRIDIVHLLPRNEFSGKSPAEVNAQVEGTFDLMEGIKVDLATAGVDSFTHIYAGDPVKEILSVVGEYGSTAIVMGTTGKGSVSEFFAGSVSHEIAEKSPVAVILVPDEKKLCE
ncbi:universal stress protein [bacterium]|nr:MAG: universal stress protein [bacterium]